MSMHSIAEAKKKLSILIDRALGGEQVVITRRGRPVVELLPVVPQARQLTCEDLDWLAARRVGTTQLGSDAGTLVTIMRDESSGCATTSS